MKKLLLFVSTMVLAVAMTSCNKPLTAPDDLQCNPNPLTVVGDKVNATITGTFNEKKFAKKATLVVTPVLKFNGKEVKGTPKTFVGEKVKENGQTIAYKAGGKYEMSVSFDYVPEMAKSELYLQFEATVGKKTYDIPEVKVADGIVATVKRATAQDLKPAVTPDKYQRVIQEMQEADIKFLIQQANLRSSETSAEGVKNLTEAIKAANNDEKKSVNSFEISGYASPDGGMDLNTNLAEKRQKVTADYMNKQFKKAKLSVNVDSKTTAEDWEGFQKLMEASNMQDKDLVLRVLSMYSDPEEREAQIKNLSAVYKNIADEVLPQLRRSRLKLTTDLIGKSDAELSKLAKEDPKQLSVEELLYAATLTNDNAEKAAIYEAAIKQYPKDYRAYNNLGLVKMAENKAAEASANYTKALNIEPNNADVNYNAGVAAMAQGKLDEAATYFGKAAGTTSDLGAAMGTLYMMQGDYNKAKSSFTNSASNNAAVQQILSEDYAGARSTLNAIKEPNALTSYLMAVVGARTNDRDTVYKNLKKAVAEDASLKTQALSDIEFAKYLADDTFKSIVK